MTARAGHRWVQNAAHPSDFLSPKPTHTPSVLVTRGRIDEQLGKVAGLTPPHERVKAFRLLVQILGLADARRRERFCADGCRHEWHQLARGEEPGLSVA
ncbi:DUF5958 family protein [Streptomyces sp. NPDC001698]|uniref:DUF5958 family protein n=1 Tax=unclassified Streptomyces TaxID=2593676 RepID=UPI0036A59F1E